MEKLYTREDVERIALDLLATSNVHRKKGKEFDHDKWLEYYFEKYIPYKNHAK